MKRAGRPAQLLACSWTRTGRRQSQQHHAAYQRRRAEDHRRGAARLGLIDPLTRRIGGCALAMHGPRDAAADEQARPRCDQASTEGPAPKRSTRLGGRGQRHRTYDERRRSRLWFVAGRALPCVF